MTSIAKFVMAGFSGMMVMIMIPRNDVGMIL
jgi:hypothetical protein